MINERFLVITSSSTGNNVFCTPAIRLIRKHKPHSLIGVVALNKLSAEVFEDNSDINHLYVINDSKALDSVAKSYTTVFSLISNSIDKTLRNLKTNVLRAPAFVQGTSRADQLLRFVADYLHVDLTNDDRQYVMGVETPHTILDTFLDRQQTRLVHIHLGLGRTALHGWKFFYRNKANNDVRLWHIDNYIRLGKCIAALYPDVRLVITGTLNEKYLAKKFTAAVPHTIDMIGKTSAADIYNMMRHVSLFIAHDCGVMHIAAATDVPIVGIYAPTEPALAGPYPPKPQHRVIKKNLMSEISVEDVFTEVKALLS